MGIQALYPNDFFQTGVSLWFNRVFYCEGEGDALLLPRNKIKHIAVKK